MSEQTIPSTRHFLRETAFSPAQWGALIDQAAALKAAKAAGCETARLQGKNVALIFEKTSTRTRCAFEVAVADQGGHTTYLDPAGSQMGHKESIADTARVLGGIFDAIEYRGDSEEKLQILADYSGVPVLNGLTDTFHPTQSLADALTMAEWLGKTVPTSGKAAHPRGTYTASGTFAHLAGGEGVRPSQILGQVVSAYLGDARFNTANSMLLNHALLGAELRIVAPRQYWPAPEIRQAAAQIAAQTGARLSYTEDVAAGVEGAEFIHTDIWVSMGEPEAAWEERIAALRPYRVSAGLMSDTGRADTKFMHCLPAFHDEETKIGTQVKEKFGLAGGIEVAHEVFESPASVVFEQAANRMPTIKSALLYALVGAGALS